jgi:hypothetical protein
MQRGRQSCALIDGKQEEMYDAITPVIFSPDSRHYSYAIIKDRKIHLITDGVAGAPFDHVRFPAWSPDSRHVCYGALDGDDAVVVLDGQRLSGDYLMMLNDGVLRWDSPVQFHFLAFQKDSFERVAVDLGK